MSFVRKTIAATVLSGVALTGAAGTAHAAVAKPKSSGTAYGKGQSATHWTQKVTANALNVRVPKKTYVTLKAYNKTNKTYKLEILVGKRKFAPIIQPSYPDHPYTGIKLGAPQASTVKITIISRVRGKLVRGKTLTLKPAS
jgi:hypothetical protein